MSYSQKDQGAIDPYPFNLFSLHAFSFHPVFSLVDNKGEIFPGRERERTRENLLSVGSESDSCYSCDLFSDLRISWKGDRQKRKQK